MFLKYSSTALSKRIEIFVLPGSTFTTAPRLASEKSRSRYFSATIFLILHPLTLVGLPRRNQPDRLGLGQVYMTTSSFPRSLSPSVTNRGSSTTWGSLRVSAKSSSSTVAASAKLTPCTRRFALALGKSHSNLTSQVYRQLSSAASLVFHAFTGVSDACPDPSGWCAEGLFDFFCHAAHPTDPPSWYFALVRST